MRRWPRNLASSRLVSGADQRILDLQWASRRRLMRLFIVFSALILAACGTPTSIRFDQVPAQTSGSLNFVDSRPKAQLVARQVVDELSTRTYFDDRAFTPSLGVILQAYLAKHLSRAAFERRVELKEFDVSLLVPAVVPISRQSIEAATRSVQSERNTSPAGVALGQLAIAAANEVSGKKTVLVEIAGALDGRPFSLFHADSFRFGVSEANIKATVTSALKRLSAQLVDFPSTR